MALITKPDMEFIWASGGAIVEPSDVKKQTGWTAEVPPHQWENWIQNRQDQMLAHINQRGIPAWDGLTNYEAGGLSYVQGSDGKVYKSVAASGPASVVSDPTTDGSDTYWTEAFASIGAFLTQTAGDARYTQRSNNLNDLTNTSTARTNLGVANAVAAGIAGSASNLKLSATGLSALVTVTANSLCVKNAGNEQVVLNSVSVTPSLSASGANGLDTGTSAVNTWYSVWVIWNGTTTAGLLSLSPTTPTLPSGYTHRARVGWTRSDGTANKFPLSFIQNGQRVRYKLATGSNLTAYPALSSGIQGAEPSTWASIGVSGFVPTTATSIDVQLTTTAQNGNNIWVSPNTSHVTTLGSQSCAPVVCVQPAASAGGAHSNGSITLEGSNIFVIAVQASGTTRTLCTGWEDAL